MPAPRDDLDLEGLLEHRRHIDQALFDKHSVQAAVLFTDIVGSTAFYEKRGDIEGLARVRRHNDLLFPVVQAHGGRVVKTIGDSIMAVFGDAPGAVRAAQEMHRALAAEPTVDEPTRIRVGVHIGRVLKDGDDVYGDAVNTAARVASAAGADEVLVSDAVVATLPGDVVVVAKGPVAMKGKAQPVMVSRVPWRADDDVTAGPAEAKPATGELFVLEIAKRQGGLKVAALDGDSDKGTVKAYADVALHDAALDGLAARFGAFVHNGGDDAYTSALQTAGRALFDQALSARARERVAQTKLSSLRLMLDDDVVHVPWELMHDGDAHLALRFAVGRMVAARAATSPSRAEAVGRVVVVSNPAGDLPAAEVEGDALAKLFSAAFAGDVHHARGETTREEFLALLGDARLVHFAGHAVPGDPGGVRLQDGVVTPTEMAEAFGATAPAFVFVNGCHASTERGWDPRAPSIAQALLSSGVRRALSPMWSIPDQDALSFALRFYEAALGGAPLGEAVLRARRSLVARHLAPMSWAGYVLYGDPRDRLATTTLRPNAPAVRSGGSVASPRASTWLPPRAQPAPHRPTAPARRPRTSLIVGAGAALALAVGGLVVVVRAPGASSVAPAPSPTSSPASAAPASAAPAMSSPATSPPTLGDATPLPRSGPVRVSVLPFHGASDDATAFLKDGLAESIVTEIGGDSVVKLVERGQIDVDIHELDFQRSAYVDPATRAAIGKIGGAEVVVLGSWQRAGDQLRIAARFVDVETGEVLATAKADGPLAQPFALQDAIGAAAKAALPDVVKRVRR